MRCLFLDLLSHSGAIACFDGKSVVSLTHASAQLRDDELLRTVDVALGKCGWTYRDLTHVACTAGPGGFTSLRVAVAFANTLIDTLHLSAAGVHLSDLCFAFTPRPPLPPRFASDQNSSVHSESACLGEGGESMALLWLHSTKKAELFVRGFGTLQALWPEPELATLEKFLERLSPTLSLRDIPPPEGEGRRKNLFWTGELIPAHREAFKDLHLAEAPLQPLESALPPFLSALPYAKKLLEPWYGRGT
ncbi:MAG: hypothetical protein V1926_00080 [Candidatus Peregrinibacteria bacterium]